jgi:hypothetical protein
MNMRGISTENLEPKLKNQIIAASSKLRGNPGNAISMVKKREHFELIKSISKEKYDDGLFAIERMEFIKNYSEIR